MKISFQEEELLMGKGRIRVEERIKVETDVEIFKAKLLDEKSISKDKRKVKEKNK
jgi:hypothetical protein